MSRVLVTDRSLVGDTPLDGVLAIATGSKAPSVAVGDGSFALIDRNGYGVAGLGSVLVADNYCDDVHLRGGNGTILIWISYKDYSLVPVVGIVGRDLLPDVDYHCRDGKITPVQD